MVLTLGSVLPGLKNSLSLSQPRLRQGLSAQGQAVVATQLHAWGVPVQGAGVMGRRVAGAGGQGQGKGQQGKGLGLVHDV